MNDHTAPLPVMLKILRNWKIEVVGSISTNCWLALSRTIMKIAFESLQTKFQWAFFNDSHRLRSSLVRFDNINHRLRLYCAISRSLPANCTA